MSTAAFPGPPSQSSRVPTLEPVQQPTGRLLAFEDYTHLHPTAPVAPPVRAAYIRRRGSLVQGRALETLGHAVEYLIDCGMFHQEAYEPQSNQAAVQILMRASRSVFEECPEIVPIGRRLGLWSRRLAARALRRSPQPAC